MLPASPTGPHVQVLRFNFSQSLMIARVNFSFLSYPLKVVDAAQTQQCDFYSLFVLKKAAYKMSVTIV